VGGERRGGPGPAPPDGGGATDRSAPSDDPYDLDAATTEHYVDAALYDLEYRRRRADVNHYRRLAQRWAPSSAMTIELGCGSGRVLVPLVRDGHAVIGMDLSQAMLARAADRLARLKPAVASRGHLLRADMRRFALRVRVPLVICPFNAFQHLYTRSDVEACLACVREHLLPGGRFALDVMQPDLRWLTRDARKRWARTRFTHPATGEKLEYSTNNTYDPVTQIVYVRLYYESGVDGDRRTRVVRLAHRQFFPAELEALLAAGGFRLDERMGGFDGEPFAGDSDSQVLVCSPS
jgi:SAM-dependent methyltransferase